MWKICTFSFLCLTIVKTVSLVYHFRTALFVELIFCNQNMVNLIQIHWSVELFIIMVSLWLFMPPFSSLHKGDQGAGAVSYMPQDQAYTGRIFSVFLWKNYFTHLNFHFLNLIKISLRFNVYSGLICNIFHGRNLQGHEHRFWGWASASWGAWNKSWSHFPEDINRAQPNENNRCMYLSICLGGTQYDDHECVWCLYDTNFA